MIFSQLNLPSSLLQGIAECGYDTLTPVQQQVLPLMHEEHDMMVCAQTGTGKTAAFALPMLARVMEQKQQHERTKLKGLILTPTRELAIQVAENVARYSQFTNLTSLAVYGGANINPQRKAVARGVDILVATPGRLFDIVGQYQLSLADIELLVIDEADRMLDMGFVKDIYRVKSLISPAHITEMYSATYNSEVKKLARDVLSNPQWIDVKPSEQSLIVQQAYLVDKRRKAELLSELIGKNNWQQLLVFASTKESADYLSRELKLDGISCAVFHGDKTQGARNRALAELRSGKVRVLVATDVAGRGIDIQGLPLVVNYELPDDNQDFIHRVGRTGRAGQTGTAISLICPAEQAQLKELEALLSDGGKVNIELTSAPGYDIGAPLPARYRDAQPEFSASKNAAARKQADKGANSREKRFKGNRAEKAKPSGSKGGKGRSQAKRAPSKKSPSKRTIGSRSH